VQAALRHDLSHYLTTRRTAEHISAVSLRVTFPGREPGIDLAAGTARYGGGPPVSTSALWQIGSNTKAFTAVILLQLEAEGKLSVSDPLGTWLPRYPAWRDVTIRQLLDMTSRIPDYAVQPAFAAAPGASFSAARLVSYVTGLPLGPKGYRYSNTNYILAQMIIERVTHDSYADQLTRRIIIPPRLESMCYAPYTCPAADAARMPAGYFYMSGAPSLPGTPMPPLALTWAQGAGAIVTSLPDMTTWDRDLYQGRELPPRQQRQLESLVSETTGQPIASTTPAGPAGYGLGFQQVTSQPTGTAWTYEGGTFGYRVVHVDFPRSGIIIALAVNSSTDPANDEPGALAVPAYQILQQAGAVHAGPNAGQHRAHPGHRGEHFWDRNLPRPPHQGVGKVLRSDVKLADAEDQQPEPQPKSGRFSASREPASSSSARQARASSAGSGAGRCGAGHLHLQIAANELQRRIYQEPRC
jgi:D-alanyl-D-alanine carboxypeptidase